MSAVLAQAAPAAQKGSPAAAFETPGDVAVVRDLVAAADLVVRSDELGPDDVERRLRRAVESGCETVLRDAAKDVASGDRAALNDAISTTVHDLVGRALESHGEQRRDALAQVIREATSLRLAQRVVDRWLGFAPQSGQDQGKLVTGSVAAQLSTPQQAGDLRLNTRSARLIEEVGHVGSVNGYADLGEWVLLELDIENGSARPWFSSSVFVHSDTPCVWADPSPKEIAELAPNGGHAPVRFWVYVSRECTGGPRKLRVGIRDTHRAPKAEQELVTSLAPIELAFPRVINPRFDSDDLGSSDGSGVKVIRPALRFEYSVDLAVPAGDPLSVKMSYALPTDLASLFSAFTYRDVPLGKENSRTFVAGDDFDATVVAKEAYERALEEARASRRWVSGPSPRLWLAVDSTVQMMRPEAAQRSVAPETQAATPQPVSEEKLVALVRKHLSLVPHPVEPALPSSVAAVSGYELGFDSSRFVAEYRAIAWPRSQTAAPEDSPIPPVSYRFRQYLSIPLATASPSLAPELSAPPAQPAAPEPSAPLSPVTYSLDVGGTWVGYKGDGKATPNLWGPSSLVDLGGIRARFTAGAGLALVVGGAIGQDGTNGDNGETNFSEREVEAGIAFRVAPTPELDVVPRVTCALRHRKLTRFDASWSPAAAVGLTLRWRFAPYTGLFVDAGGRLGPEGKDHHVSGSGFDVSAGVSLLW